MVDELAPAGHPGARLLLTLSVLLLLLLRTSRTPLAVTAAATLCCRALSAHFWLARVCMCMLPTAQGMQPHPWLIVSIITWLGAQSYWLVRRAPPPPPPKRAAGLP